MRIGNASGFYGDRFAALREMLTGGPLDVLTGDYLAELTMLILARDRMKDPRSGYAKTFLRQLEEGLGTAHERGVRLVVNAGGLNPAGLAAAVRELAERVGVPVRVAHVEGDDLLDRTDLLDRDGLLTDPREGLLTANAYLGGAGIAACLRAGADVVVTGRVTDAALVSGAAAAHFGWGEPPHEGGQSATERGRSERDRSERDRSEPDWDALAGAVVAGHVLECGTQATGGNYAFFAQEGIDVRHPGFPVAELHVDGTAVITKHPGTGGAVTVGTVTAQLLYETGGARYAGPDVTARLDSVRLSQAGPDRVRIEGVRGEAPPPTLKAGLTRLGGFRNEVGFVLTGLDIEAKAALVRAQMAAHLDGSAASAPAGSTGPAGPAGPAAPAEVRWTLARTDRADAPVQEEASALLRLVVRDPDEATVGRAVSGAAIELALASIPGFHVTAPPGKGAPYGAFEAVYVDAAEVPHTAVLPDGRRREIPRASRTRELAPVPDPPLPPPLPAGRLTRRVPLGTFAGARSGDKGGSANVGVWVRSDGAWRWLAHELTVERLRVLLPEIRELAVTRHLLPNLRAANFLIEDLLGEGVAAQARFDPQAKALGEWLRSRHVEVPEELLP